MKVTIKDVARETGYSKSTVSCALNGKNGVGGLARKEIIDCAKKLGYIPNIYAQSISSGSSNTIGVILRDITNPFYADVFCAIDEVVESKHYQTLFYNLADNPERIKKGLELFKGKMLSGIVIDYFGHDESVMKMILDLGIPTVIFGQIVNENISSVEADDIKGAKEAVNYAFKLGVPNIFYVTHKSHDVYNDRRKKAIQEQSKLLGYTFDHNNVIFVNKNEEFSEKIITNCPPNSLLICYNDSLACKCISELMKKKIYVPENYSVIGFDNLEIVPYSLTTIDIPKYKMARAAANILFEQIEDKNLPKKIIKFDSFLVVRDSVKNSKHE